MPHTYEVRMRQPEFAIARRPITAPAMQQGMDNKPRRPPQPPPANLRALIVSESAELVITQAKKGRIEGRKLAANAARLSRLRVSSASSKHDGGPSDTPQQQLDSSGSDIGRAVAGTTSTMSSGVRVAPATLTRWPAPPSTTARGVLQEVERLLQPAVAVGESTTFDDNEKRKQSLIRALSLIEDSYQPPGVIGVANYFVDFDDVLRDASEEQLKLFESTALETKMAAEIIPATTSIVEEQLRLAEQLECRAAKLEAWKAEQERAVATDLKAEQDAIRDLLALTDVGDDKLDRANLRLAVLFKRQEQETDEFKDRQALITRCAELQRNDNMLRSEIAVQRASIRSLIEKKERVEAAKEKELSEALARHRDVLADLKRIISDAEWTQERIDSLKFRQTDESVRSQQIHSDVQEWMEKLRSDRPIEPSGDLTPRPDWLHMPLMAACGISLPKHDVFEEVPVVEGSVEIQREATMMPAAAADAQSQSSAGASDQAPTSTAEVLTIIVDKIQHQSKSQKSLASEIQFIKKMLAPWTQNVNAALTLSIAQTHALVPKSDCACVVAYERGEILPAPVWSKAEYVQRSVALWSVILKKVVGKKAAFDLTMAGQVAGDYLASQFAPDSTPPAPRSVRSGSLSLSVTKRSNSSNDTPGSKSMSPLASGLAIDGSATQIAASLAADAKLRFTPDTQAQLQRSMALHYATWRPFLVDCETNLMGVPASASGGHATQSTDSPPGTQRESSKTNMSVVSSNNTGPLSQGLSASPTSVSAANIHLNVVPFTTALMHAAVYEYDAPVKLIEGVYSCLGNLEEQLLAVCDAPPARQPPRSVAFRSGIGRHWAGRSVAWDAAVNVAQSFLFLGQVAAQELAYSLCNECEHGSAIGTGFVGSHGLRWARSAFTANIVPRPLSETPLSSQNTNNNNLVSIDAGPIQQSVSSLDQVEFVTGDASTSIVSTSSPTSSKVIEQRVSVRMSAVEAQRSASLVAPESDTDASKVFATKSVSDSLLFAVAPSYVPLLETAARLLYQQQQQLIAAVMRVILRVAVPSVQAGTFVVSMPTLESVLFDLVYDPDLSYTVFGPDPTCPSLERDAVVAPPPQSRKKSSVVDKRKSLRQSVVGTSPLGPPRRRSTKTFQEPEQPKATSHRGSKASQHRYSIVADDRNEGRRSDLVRVNAALLLDHIVDGCETLSGESHVIFFPDQRTTPPSSALLINVPPPVRAMSPARSPQLLTFESLPTHSQEKDDATPRTPFLETSGRGRKLGLPAPRHSLLSFLQESAEAASRRMSRTSPRTLRSPRVSFSLSSPQSLRHMAFSTGRGGDQPRSKQAVSVVGEHLIEKYPQALQEHRTRVLQLLASENSQRSSPRREKKQAGWEIDETEDDNNSDKQKVDKLPYAITDDFLDVEHIYLRLRTLHLAAYLKRQ